MIDIQANIEQVKYQYEQHNNDLYSEFYNALEKIKKKSSPAILKELYIIEETFLRKTNIIDFAYKNGLKDAFLLLNKENQKLIEEINSVTG